jgi:branched-chain amino acid transport system permease protein
VDAGHDPVAVVVDEEGPFTTDRFGDQGLLPDRVDRPEIFMLNFDDGRSFYYLTLVSLVLVMVVVTVLRRSRVGRVLIGLRENENNMRSFGVNPVRMRLLAFAISGAICRCTGSNP